MYLINIITKKLIATSCQLSAFRKPTANSYQLLAFRNLPPTTYHLPPSHGFTLIETLVAISILMIAIASPLTIAQKGVASAIYAKDQIIASYLAQDAIEFLINKSDINKSNKVDWLYDISEDGNCGDPDSSCRVDTVSGNIENCGNDVCDTPLNYSDDDHTYSYGSATEGSSRFTRSITVKEVNLGIEALITVLMSWEDKGKMKNLTFKTRIFNWKK